MNNKSMDFLQIFALIVLFITFLAIMLDVIFEGEINNNWTIGILLFLILLFEVLFKPFCYKFNEKNITLYYVYGTYQIIEWKDILKIEKPKFPQNLYYYRVYIKERKKSHFLIYPRIRINKKNKDLIRRYGDINIFKNI